MTHAGVNAAPLNDADVEAVLRIVARASVLERLDPRLGTDECRRFLRRESQTISQCSSCEDGPYSDGENPEWWSRMIEITARGAEVSVKHETRRPPVTTVLRAGSLPWNNLANRATLAALALRRETMEPMPGQQVTLF